MTKDIVENRARIGLFSKLKLLGIIVRENGLGWSLFMGMYYVASCVQAIKAKKVSSTARRLADYGYARATRLRANNSLPGVNSTSANRHIWTNWDWGAGGEEWTLSPDWKASVVCTFLDPIFSGRSVILEIGPGAGRWTEYLLDRCDQLIGVDISPSSVRACEHRFRDRPNARFEVGNGEDLSSIPSNSIDAVWSFDVFVHINKRPFKSYVREIARVLKAGGVGVIQHGSVSGESGGWRSDVKTSDVREFLQTSGLVLERQLQSWNDCGKTFPAGLYGDTITCFRKPVP